MSDYWKDYNLLKYSTANQFFFRFLNSLKFRSKNKKVLEIGFLHGDDLKELKRRGSKIYGLELTNNALKKFKIFQKKNILKIDISKNKIPFKCKFDLIFHNDFLYYLNDINSRNHLENVYERLNKNGLFLFSFIETELKIKSIPKSFSDIKFKAKKARVTKKNNPIRFLNREKLLRLGKEFNFVNFGEKLILESFDKLAKTYKIHRYIAFKK